MDNDKNKSLSADNAALRRHAEERLRAATAEVHPPEYRSAGSDVTEHTLAEQALRENEERLRFALKTSHIGAWDMDLDDHTCVRSLEHDRIYGYPELLPKWTYEMFLEHVLPEDRAMVDGVIRRAMENRSDWSFECRIRRPDGQVRWLWAAGRHCEYTAGTSRRMVAGIVQDITEQKQILDELRQAKEGLEQRVAERTEELSQINGLLRQEITERTQAEDSLRISEAKYRTLYENMIQGAFYQNSDGALVDINDAALKMKDYLTKITSAADNLLLLLNDLLDFSKIEAGKLELEVIAFPLRHFLEQLESLMWSKAVEKGLRLSFTTDPATPEYLRSDPLRLQQILLNLLSNAVKFTSQGEVALVVRPLTDDGEQVTLQFSVRDTGIGLTPDQIDGIFEPFTQGDSSTTRQFGGTGLGLSICRRLATLMGGRVEVTSIPGQGSTFTFTVRFRRGSAADIPPEPVFSKADVTTLRGRRVLVAEDQLINRQVVREVLEQVGVNVTLAGDGREAVAAGNDAGPSLPGDHRTQRGDLPDHLSGLDLDLGLELLAGNADTYRRLIISFARNRQGLGQEIRTALEAADLTHAGFLAHTLRGVAGNLAATSLHVVASDLESACAQGLADQTGVLLPLLEARLAEVLASAETLARQDTVRELVVKTFDPDRALMLVRELAVLAHQHNLSALDQSEELSLLLAGTGLAMQAGNLEETVARLDFRTASRQLEELTLLLEEFVTGMNFRERSACFSPFSR